MFRKSICLFMTVIMLLALAAVPATAEDAFTLRNGIRFGDSMATVREKETLPFKEDECTQERLWTQKGTVAGFPNVQLLYVFTDGKLQQVKWQLDEYPSNDAYDDVYAKLYKSYVGKYGDALGYTNGSCHLITTTAMEGAVLTYTIYRDYLDGVGDMRDYDEWIVDFGKDEHVKIDLAQFYYGESYSKLKRTIWIGYKYFTEAEWDAAIQQKKTENQAVLNDI